MLVELAMLAVLARLKKTLIHSGANSKWIGEQPWKRVLEAFIYEP